ncbi:hypothetical protein JCM10914A_29400 [Paenibacillus sp. JCM 10914]|uniref:B-box zinc finger protein n=1 Tax=Paenibacillus sp. JCM 10914 TaxID=1236974 RepID=UPI0003CC2D44|nr:B-box zinc finger protein [Paenibacillus sp. JCM 10914]GAE09437.1 hypothetical protein JCM10914_5797 [Paenibacillus sp. JCM 10914]
METAYQCMNHPGRPSVAQCTRCGKPICEECSNQETGRCRYRCGEFDSALSGAKRPRSIWWSIIVSILAVTGGLLLLFLAICGTLLMSM